MTASKDETKALVPAATQTETPLVVRTHNVPVETEYGRYRPYLRFDFFFSCAYCTMSEAEAEAIRFTIDHYEPQTARHDLVAVYANLMYACDECNIRKGDRYPPPSARDNGYRFFRPDEDLFSEHFAGKDLMLSHKSNVGFYTINALDLNRKALQRLREIRLRLLECERYVAEGIAALRKFHIDQLPQHIRARAQRAIREAVSIRDEMIGDIDKVLREAAQSSVLNAGIEETEHIAQRRSNLKHLEGLYPDSWRASKKRKKKN